MPRTKKPLGATVDPLNGRRITYDVEPVQYFTPPVELSYECAVYWEDYWADPVSQVVTRVDRATLTRWITSLDRYFKLTREADEDPIVSGSQGQPVENPKYASAHRALADAEKCEAQLGIGPLNRSRLGIAVLHERRALGSVGGQHEGGVTQGDNDSVNKPRRADPRVIDGA